MDTDGGYFEPNCKRQIPAHHLGSARGDQRGDHPKTRRLSTETNLSRSAGGDVFDEFKAGFGVDNLGCGVSTKTGIQMCPTLGTDSCFGTASSAFCELQEAWERRDHTLMWCLARKLGGKKWSEKKDSSTCHHRSDPAVQIGKIFCAVT